MTRCELSSKDAPGPGGMLACLGLLWILVAWLPPSLPCSTRPGDSRGTQGHPRMLPWLLRGGHRRQVRARARAGARARARARARAGGNTAGGPTAAGDSYTC